MIADSLGPGRLAAGRDIADLVASDNPTDDRVCPVIVRGNQSSQCRRAAPM